VNKNIHYVNNTCQDISFLFKYFKDAYVTGALHEDVADLFSIKIIKGCNPDGSDRMAIDMA
jgi:hypothetical protein